MSWSKSTAIRPWITTNKWITAPKSLLLVIAVWSAPPSCEICRTGGYANLLTRTRAELDLTHQTAVGAFFAREKPDYVFLAAAKVGGIHANNGYPAEFIRDNLAIQTNIIHAAYTNNIKRLLFLGSSCIYPKLAPQPMEEEHLLTGQLEPTNRPYALAKIAGIEMCWSYNRQYCTQYLAVMPSNP